MAFAADTALRVLMALELPITPQSYLQNVQDALNDAFTSGGDTAVTLIEGYLDQYDAAVASLNSDAANAGLIRADVLEWAAGARSDGYKAEAMRLRNLIANVLNLSILMDNGSRGNRVAIRRG